MFKFVALVLTSLWSFFSGARSKFLEACSWLRDPTSLGLLDPVRRDSVNLNDSLSDAELAAILSSIPVHSNVSDFEEAFLEAQREQIHELIDEDDSMFWDEESEDEGLAHCTYTYA
jgi:hypothetical protein